MPNFAYQARDAKGERVNGAHEAADQRAALEALRALGLFVTKLEVDRNGGAASIPVASVASVPAPSTPGEAALPSRKWELEPNRTPPIEQPVPITPAPSTPERAKRETKLSPLSPSPSSQLKPGETVAIPRVPAPQTATTSLPPRYLLRSNFKEIALFFRQMHAMLHAGTSLAHALTTMATNAPNKALRTACGEMSTRVATGQPWSELMKSYPGIFSPLMTGMIRAGEAGGFLDRMCLRLSEYAERDYEIQQTIKRETWYPKLLVFVSFFIPSLIPAIIAAFQGGNWLAIWLRAFIGPASIMLAAILIWRFKNYLTPLFKHFNFIVYLVDQVKLLIPIGGKTTRALATAKFCRALGALQAAGMGVQQTIHLSADACGNAVIAETSRKTIKNLEGGSSLTEALASTGQFPGIAIQMLRTGEATGNFDEQLDKVADFLEQDAETTIKQSVVVLGIVIFLFIAIYIGIQVITQYVSMYGNIMDQGEKMGE